MLRNREVPQGIKTTRLGFPVRQEGGAHLSSDSKTALLRNYSLPQLSTLSNKLEQSKKRWTVVERGAQALTLLAALGSYGVMIASGIEGSHNLPYDPIVSTVSNGLDKLLPAMNHIGIQDKWTEYAALSGAAVIAPFVTGVFAEQVASTRQTQTNKIDNEMMRRPTK